MGKIISFDSLWKTSQGLLLIALSFASTQSQASTESVSPSVSEVDYGELYVEQTKPRVIHPWQVAINYGYGFSNPFLGIHGAEIQAQRQFFEFFRVGVAGAYYGTTTKDLASQLESHLSAQGIQTIAWAPQYSFHAQFGFIPLAGMLNWLSLRPIDFDLPLVLGVGAIRYVQASSLVPSIRIALMPQAFFTEHFGVQVGLQNQIEYFGGSEWQSRFEALVGLVGRF